MTDKRRIVLTLRAIAAAAEKLADDVEQQRLWPGEYGRACGEINRHVRDLPADDGQGKY